MLILSLFFSLSIYAADIPDDLEEMGFTKNTLVDYRTESNISFYTFSDWQTEEPGDTITFAVEDGEVANSFKGDMRTDIVSAEDNKGKSFKNEMKDKAEGWFGKEEKE